MKHLLLADDMFLSHEKIKLHGTSYNHIIKALRNKKNDIITGFYGSQNTSTRFTIRIDEVHSSYALASVLKREKVETRHFALTLVISYPKERAIVPLIEKTSELGVDAIVFVQTKYSQRAFPKDSSKKRYERIAQEASQQSGCMKSPVISYIPNFSGIDFSQFSCRLCAYELEKKTFFDLYTDTDLNRYLKNACIFVGPEGGIAEEEITALKQLGFVTVGLGDTILRVETAAISLTFLMRYLQIKYIKAD